jgi:arylsulfatase A-like enzyme
MSPKYASRTGIYSIPLIFYQKDKISPQRNLNLAQQDDIFPSVIDYLGIQDSIVAFGNSVFNPERLPFVINYINESYQYMEGDYALHFDREKAIGLFNYKLDPLLENNLLVEESLIAEKMKRKVKAIIQQYQIALINNRLSH